MAESVDIRFVCGFAGGHAEEGAEAIVLAVEQAQAEPGDCT